MDKPRAQKSIGLVIAFEWKEEMFVLNGRSEEPWEGISQTSTPRYRMNISFFPSSSSLPAWYSILPFTIK